MTTKSNQNFPDKFLITHYPELMLAGHHFHDDKNHQVVYTNQNFNSIHLYGYPCVLRIYDEEYHINVGDVSFISKNTPYSYHVPAAGKHFVLHYYDVMSMPCQKNYSAPIHMTPKALNETIFLKCQDILHCWSSAYSNALSKDLADSKLHELRLWLLTQHGEKSQSAKFRAEKSIEIVAAHIDENFHLPLDLHKCCDLAGLSQNYLARLFKSRYGMSMNHYQLLRRMELARFLLTNSSMPIKAIGSRVGMSDAQYFNKKYREIAKTSPSCERKGLSTLTLST